MPTQPAAPARTGTATILFTDLVGSTAQRAGPGEEATETLRRGHDRLLADAVAAHHGEAGALGMAREIVRSQRLLGQ
jgi:class 3 adenylate cyclase